MDVSKDYETHEDFPVAGQDNDWNEQLSTPKGVDINIKADGTFAMYYVEFSKGRMPPQLKGRWTSYEDAEKAVTTYLVNHKDHVRNKEVIQRRKK